MNRANSKISTIILTKNDATRIASCMQSVSWTDEIIIVDNGSTDDTKKIARKMGAFVVEDKVRTDFAHLRNTGRESAKGNFLLYVDSDELVSPELASEIQATVRNYKPGTSPAAYFLRRKNFYLGHPWPYQDKMERFFWSKGLNGWAGQIHESPKIYGSVGEFIHPLVHTTHRTLEEMVVKTNQWSEIEAVLRFQAGHPTIVWWRFIRVMIASFNESFFHQRGFQAGAVGWIESMFQAFSTFITYAKLWEIQNKISSVS